MNEVPTDQLLKEYEEALIKSQSSGRREDSHKAGSIANKLRLRGHYKEMIAIYNRHK